MINGTGAVALLVLRGGTVVYNTTGTLGGASIISGNGVLDFGGNAVATACTNPLDIYGQAAFLNDPNKRLGAIVVDLNEGASLAQLNLGVQIRLTRGTPA